MKRMSALITLCFTLLVEIIRSSFFVLRSIVIRPAALRSRWVWIDLHFKYDLQTVILMHLITLTPGTVSVRVSEDGKKLLIHVLNCDSEESVQQDIERLFSRRLREIFE